MSEAAAIATWHLAHPGRAQEDDVAPLLALLARHGELTEHQAVDASGAGSTDQGWRSRFLRGTPSTSR
jgi:hypothetical protein